MPWITHKEYAEKMGFKKPDGSIDYKQALNLCSDKVEPKKCPFILDRRHVMKLSIKKYQVYYEPWNGAGQRIPKPLDRRQWLENNSKHNNRKEMA